MQGIIAETQVDVKMPVMINISARQVFIDDSSDTMKKLIVVFDGNHFSEGSLEFARKLNEIEPILLTGLFLPSIDYSEVMVYYLGGMAGPIISVYDQEESIKDQNLANFKRYCEQQGIEYRIHDTITEGIFTELKQETRFADLMILSSELFYQNLGNQGQEKYTADAIHEAECPILIVPEHYQFPENLILAYDGSYSSVYAIKQFIYLFPQLTSLDTMLVYADKTSLEIPEHYYIEEYAGRHFNDLTFYKLDVDPKQHFSDWLADRTKSLLVTGAFGRSNLSLMFKKSFATEIISEHKLPVFIAHK